MDERVKELLDRVRNTAVTVGQAASVTARCAGKCAGEMVDVVCRFSNDAAASVLNLPAEVADLVAAGDLSEGHARALLGAENERDMVNLSRQVVQRGLNVRQTESLVKYMRETAEPKPERPRCAELALVEEAARRRFGTKVTVTGNARKGKVVLHYSSPEDLERIYEFIRIQED